MSKDKKKIIITIIVMLVIVCIYLLIIISKDKEKGTIIIRYNLFSDYTYEIYDDHIVLLFYKETKEKTVSIPDRILGKPVTEIGAYCFAFVTQDLANCNRQFQTINLGKNINKIGDNAFLGCESLLDVRGKNVVETIGSGAFDGCTNLEVFEPQLVEIQDYAFAVCVKMSGINEASRITYIGECAFSSCKQLKTIGEQPELVYVGDGAFGYSGLEEFYCTSQTEFGTSVFKGTPYEEQYGDNYRE